MILLGALKGPSWSPPEPHVGPLWEPPGAAVLLGPASTAHQAALEAARKSVITKPSETSEFSEPAETSESSEPSEPPEPPESSERSEPSEPSEPSGPSEPSETPQTLEASEPSQLSEPSEPHHFHTPQTRQTRQAPQSLQAPRDLQDSQNPQDPSEPEDLVRPPRTTTLGRGHCALRGRHGVRAKRETGARHPEASGTQERTSRCIRGPAHPGEDRDPGRRTTARTWESCRHNSVDQDQGQVVY